MNVSEFMNMFVEIELIDEAFKLTTCVSIFVQCNQAEVSHFLGPAISGYKLEERLQMTWPEFSEALLECAVLKYGEACTPLEAFTKFAGAISSGWHRFKALHVLKKVWDENKRKWKNVMQPAGHRVNTVPPLRAGVKRVNPSKMELPSPMMID